MSTQGDITMWLQRLREGDDSALEYVVPLLYDELHRLARSHLRLERKGHTLGATALVNEVYLKLVGRQAIDARDRVEFFRIAGSTMRRFLCDYARTRKRLKRGSGRRPMSFDEVERFLTEEEAEEVLALDEALDRLAEIDPRGSEVVQYRFFTGLTMVETAEALGISIKTVQRDWNAARAWLRKEIARDLQI